MTVAARIATRGAPRWFLGTLYHPLLSGDETDGRFALWESVMPRGAAPPLHTHPQDETFTVLEGKLVVWAVEPDATADERWIDTHAEHCEPGAAVFVPAGVPHTFRVESDTARLLFLSTPAGIEDYVRELSEPAAWPWLQPPPDGPRVAPERLEAVEREHRVMRVGPPPTHRPKEEQ